jgi:hypothetical protein
VSVTHGIRLWAGAEPIARIGYDPDLVQLGAENSARNSSGTPIWAVFVGAVAVIAVACVSWWLARAYRREDQQREDEHRHHDRRRDEQYRHQDHQREDLAGVRRLLEDADLQVRRLSRLESAAGRGDLADLEDLRVRIERIADRGPEPLRSPFAAVSECIDAYTDAAVPDVAEVMEIYCKTSEPEDVPMSWRLEGLLKRAEHQGRAASALADAIHAAEQAVDTLRAG